MKLEDSFEVARSGKLYPSVILHGADPAQRREAAARLARTLLCEVDAESRPCGRCRHCERIGSGAEGTSRGSGDGAAAFHPDYQILERDLKTVTSVEAAKSFLRGAQVSPFEARGQVFVIASAESLSGEAANTLLKTLEEPAIRSPRNFFLLAPSRLDLLPTLRSRSLAIYLPGGSRPTGADLAELAAELGSALDVYWSSRRRAELFGAASVLDRCGSWRDPGSLEPWERAAAVAMDCAVGLPAGPRRRGLLAVAQDLLDAPPQRARGIPASRIVEGSLFRRLADVE